MKNYLSLIICSLLLNSCSKDFISLSKSPNDVFERFWKYGDENYVYFQYKGIDWIKQKNMYANKISPNITDDSLFNVCSSMLFELKDGHSYLNNGKIKSQYDYSTGYDVNFDFDLVKAKYLNNTFQTKGFYTYGIIQDTIGYMYYEKFSKGGFF